MRAGLLLLVSLAAPAFLVPSAWAASTQCEPGADQVAVFDQRDFQGKCALRDLGAYPKTINLGIGTAGVSAVKVGANVQLFACDKSYFAGKCELLTADDPDLADNPIGDDHISSMKVQKRGESTSCEPRADEVALFEDRDFKGPCEVRGAGTYGDDRAMGVRNDQLSSVKLGSAVQVVLCAERNLEGNCQRLTESQPNLATTRIGNDKVSSARVQKKGEQDCVPGPKQVALFMHNGFLAPCEIEELGEHPDLATGTLKKESISSIRVGSEVQAVLCRHPSFAGDCELFTSDDETLTDNHLGNDKALSLKVQPKGFEECVPKVDEASLFEHPAFLAPCVVKKIGDYADAAAIGLHDNAIASLRIGETLQVCACADQAFGGACSVFTGDAPGVGSSIGIISSVRVQPRGAACSAGSN